MNPLKRGIKGVRRGGLLVGDTAVRSEDEGGIAASPDHGRLSDKPGQSPHWDTDGIGSSVIEVQEIPMGLRFEEGHVHLDVVALVGLDVIGAVHVVAVAFGIAGRVEAHSAIRLGPLVEVATIAV